MDSINNRIKYFRDCYRSDNRDMVLNDFFSLSNPIYIDKREELLTGEMVCIPVDGSETLKASKLYSYEMDLIYTSFFLVGKIRAKNNKLIKICAPLIYYPAEIRSEGEFEYLSIDKSKRRFNYSIINTIKDEDDEDSSIYDEIGECFKKDEIGTAEIGAFTSVLEKYIPELNTDPLLNFPELIPVEKLKAMLRPSSLEKQVNFKIVPASGAGLYKKSADTMGVLNELKIISESSTFSNPVRTLISDDKIRKSYYEKGRVPSVLNLPQEKIIKAAPVYPFSLMVGPPGTGKSYTIASLAVEHISKGKSVLIASKTNQAVDVIYEKIEKQIGLENVIVRGGRSTYLTGLKEYLRFILSGASENSKKMEINFRLLESIDRKIENLERIFKDRVERDTIRGKFLAENNDSANIFKKIRRKFIELMTRSEEPLWEIVNSLENYTDYENRKTVEFIKKKYGLTVQSTLKNKREDLKNFLSAISKRRGTEQEEIFGKTDFKVILKTFPVWLVKLSEIYKVLPLKEELFDLAIIDEATQCDIASIIPVLMRAKSVVFAGDPNQLRHVSFLSRDRQRSLMEKYSLPDNLTDFLNYRDKSILDIVFDKIEDQDQVVFLNEHYRSTPEIISFSNSTFYNSAIRIMTSKPNIPENEGVFLVKANGVRTKGGYNEEEAYLLLDKVSDIMYEQRDLYEGVCSIGILSPFRSQVDYLLKEVEKKFSIADIEKHNLMIATAYGFQGEERDIMLLSFALDNNSHPSAFIHINKRDVFNVSITRARSIQYVFCSVDAEKLKKDSILRKYLESIDNKQRKEEKKNHILDNFSKEVKKELKNSNINSYIAYPIAGLELDIVLSCGDKTVGIDLIGYPGEFEDAFSLERYKMLKRAGLRTFPLPYTNWILEREKCIEAIKALFEEQKE